MPAPHGSRLGSGLIVRKGEAAPATAAVSVPPAAADPEPAPTAPAPAAVATAIPKGVAGTIAVTVRLDPARYERLKMHGVRARRSNQQIIVDALDAYLERGPN